MTERKYWIIALALGLLTIIVMLVMGAAFVPLGEGASDLSSYGGPILAFEFSQNQTDLLAIFGAGDDPLKAKRIASMDAGNRWDFAFMAAYSLFMASVFLAAHAVTKQKLWWAFIAIALLAGFADAYENTILLGMTKELESTQAFGLLAIPVWTKFFSIMLAGWGTGWFLLTRSHMALKVAGVLIALGASVVIPAFLSPATNGQFIGSGIGLYWTLTLILAGVFAWRPGLAANA